MEASSLYIATKCMKIYSTSPNEPSPINAYTATSQYTKVTEEQRRRYVDGGADQR